jgi:hypothetical protein
VALGEGECARVRTYLYLFSRGPAAAGRRRGQNVDVLGGLA